MTKHLQAQTGLKNLCLAGGVALNCVANGRLLREGPFENVWVQPASGDAGGAIGAALFAWHQLLDNSRQPLAFATPFLGPTPDGELADHLSDDAAIQAAAERFDSVELLVGTVADILSTGETVGWMQGAMEFGPRALGNRSILANPQDPAMTCRRNGPSPNGIQTSKFKTASITGRFRIQNGMSGPDQYELQCSWPADCLFSPRRIGLLF